MPTLVGVEKYLGPHFLDYHSDFDKNALSEANGLRVALWMDFSRRRVFPKGGERVSVYVKECGFPPVVTVSPEGGVADRPRAVPRVGPDVYRTSSSTQTANLVEGKTPRGEPPAYGERP